MSEQSQHIDSAVLNGIITQLKFRCSEEDWDILRNGPFAESLRYLNGTCFYTIAIENGQCLQIVDETMLSIMAKAELIMPALVISEFGGYNPNDAYGIAHTVCGLSGKALNPFHISEEPNKNHATFAIPRAAIVCRAAHHSDKRWNLTVYDIRFEFDRERMTVEYHVVEHWRGSRFNETKRRYVTAMAFAMAKASTPFCCGPAFYQLPDREQDTENHEDQ